MSTPSKFTINLSNKPLLGLDDQPIQGEGLGKSLAGILAFSQSGAALKYVNWARDLFKGRQIEVNLQEREELLQLVRNSPVQNLVKAQIEEEILRQASLEPTTPSA